MIVSIRPSSVNRIVDTARDPLHATCASQVLLGLLLPVVQEFPLFFFQKSSHKLLARLVSTCLTHRTAVGDVRITLLI